jgi:hypothetical protein
MVWHEVRLRPDADLREFYKAIPVGSLSLYHHFWDEPWWPNAYVVRVASEDADAYRSYPGVDHVVPWDASEDEAAYTAQWWPYVAEFFCLSSIIAAGGRSESLDMKLVHCFLNARGLSEWDEAKFAARLFWNRITIKPRLRWRALRASA